MRTEISLKKKIARTHVRPKCKFNLKEVTLLNLTASEAILRKNKTVPMESQGEISHASCLKKQKTKKIQQSLKTPEDTLPSSSPLYKRFLDPARRQ